MKCPYCYAENFDNAAQCNYCHRPIFGGAPAPQPQYTSPAQVQQSQYQQPQYYSPQPVYQQPTPIQPAHQQAPSPQPEPPKKRSKAKVFIAIVIVVVLILSIAAAVILFIPEDDEDNDNDKLGSTVTAKEMCDDWSTLRGRFSSWDDGDKVIIRDRISDIEYITSGSEYGDVSWTILTFESTSLTVDDFYDNNIPIDELWGFMIFSGDLTKGYSVGDKVDVEIIIKDYEIDEEIGEVPDWCVGLMDANKGDLEFTEIDFPNISRISHAD